MVDWEKRYWFIGFNGLLEFIGFVELLGLKKRKLLPLTLFLVVSIRSKLIHFILLEFNSKFIFLLREIQTD